MGDNSLYHVLALISKNHKYNKMKSSFIYVTILFSALTRMFPKPTFAP